MSLRTGILAAMAALGLAVLGVWWFAPSIRVEAAHLMDRETLEAFVTRAGIWGPLIIIGLMTVAVVVSPIPSAPIALAAGGAYGHVWGTVQVVVGAELGALTAFGLAIRPFSRFWPHHEATIGPFSGVGVLGRNMTVAASVKNERSRSRDLWYSVSSVLHIRIWTCVSRCRQSECPIQCSHGMADMTSPTRLW